MANPFDAFADFRMHEHALILSGGPEHRGMACDVTKLDDIHAMSMRWFRH